MKAFVPTINYKFVCLPKNASSCRVLNMKFAPIFNPDKIPANIAINNTQQSRPKQQSGLKNGVSLDLSTSAIINFRPT